MTKHLNFRINGQRVERINRVKYLGLVVNEFLVCRTHFIHSKKKLNQTIGLLSKTHDHTSQNLKSTYFSLFNSHLIYGCKIWVQEHTNEFKKLGKLQEKAIKIIKFSSQQCYRNKINEKVKNPKIQRLHYTSKHSLCERLVEK